MYVSYKPDSGDEQRWDFDDKRVKASEAELIEKRYGDNWDAWRMALQAGNMRARRVLLWHLLRREHHTLRWEDTPDFYAGELELEYSVEELRALRERIEKATLDDDKREDLLSAIDFQLSEAIARDDAAGIEEPGKAPSPDGENATGAPSPKRSASRRGTSASASRQTS